jgi:signal transduction histidine kinase
MDEEEQNFRRTLARVGARLGKIKHDANNPLAIVSGNAQLLRELASIHELGEEFMGPIRDIVDASERVAEALNELTALQRSLPDDTDGSR